MKIASTKGSGRRETEASMGSRERADQPGSSDHDQPLMTSANQMKNFQASLTLRSLALPVANRTPKWHRCGQHPFQDGPR